MSETLRKPRRRQQRSIDTKRRLVEAALDCIAELGYAGASVDRIVARAGVSRGAQVHHFPTKSLLMQAAMDHMLSLLIDDLRTQTEEIRLKRTNPSVVFRSLWNNYFSQRLFSITMELIVASRTDVELREVLTPITESFHQQIDDAFYILCRGLNYSDTQMITAVNLTMCLLRGMGAQVVLFDRPEYFQTMLDQWLKVMENLLALPSTATPQRAVEVVA